MLEMDYELTIKERTDDETGKMNPYSFVTRNLINMAFHINYAAGMPSKIAKGWKSIRKPIDKAIKDGCDYVILSEGELDSLSTEVYKCDYLPAQGQITPVLYEELDKVVRRSEAEEEIYQAEVIKFREDIAHHLEKQDREQMIPSEKDLVPAKLQEVQEAQESK